MKLSVFARETIKNHAKGVARILLIHMLAVALGWAAFPLILMIFAMYTTTDVPMAVFSVVATVVYAAMLVVQGNAYGLQDRLPYGWARYKAKGFVIGGAAGTVVYLFELLMIAIADRNFTVNHPQFAISNINNYIRMILAVPFFWFYRVIGGVAIIPRVTALTALFVIPFCALCTGIGYVAGQAGVEIDPVMRKRRKNGS